MFIRNVTVRNQTGLHIRPAGMFVETASRFRSAIKVRKGDQEADGQSVLSLMLLEVTPGTDLIIQGEGEDEVAAVDALIRLVEGDFAEKEARRSS